MAEREIKRGGKTSRRAEPTVVHESSAGRSSSFRDEDRFSLSFEEARQRVSHKRIHNGSDGGSNQPRGSNH